MGQKQELDLVVRQMKTGEWYYYLRKPCGDVIREKQAPSEHFAHALGKKAAFDFITKSGTQAFTVNLTVEKE